MIDKNQIFHTTKMQSAFGSSKQEHYKATIKDILFINCCSSGLFALDSCNSHGTEQWHWGGWDLFQRESLQQCWQVSNYLN